MKAKQITRRRAVQIGVAAALPLVHIRTAGAAGKLNVGFWDHWVPGGTEAMRKQVMAWAVTNKVDVTADFITSQGNKLLLTAAAEGQAQTGHDFIPFLQWDTIAYADQLEPVDDVINPLIGKYGKYDPTVEYLAKSKGYWTAVPGTDPTAGLTCCARISMLKQYAGVDIMEIYPARPSDPSLSAKWTYETISQGGRGLSQSGLSLRHGSRVNG